MGPYNLGNSYNIGNWDLGPATRIMAISATTKNNMMMVEPTKKDHEFL